MNAATSHPASPRATARWVPGLLGLLALLSALLWPPRSLAAEGLLLEAAYVLDPAGTMTLEEAQAATLIPFRNVVDNSLDPSSIWIRLRVAGSDPSAGPQRATVRLVPMWTQTLALHDPLQRDADGRALEIPLRASTDASQVYLVDIPLGNEARDLWVRFTPSGPSLIAAEVLTPEASTNRQVWDAMVESIAIGMLSVLLLAGAVVWWIDRTGLGMALFLKQFLNLALALQPAGLLISAGLLEASALTGPTSLQVGLLRVLNQGTSLWFFIKVLQVLQAAPWAVRAQRLLLGAVVANAGFILIGDEATFRYAGALLHALVLAMLLVSGFACPVQSLAGARSLARPIRVAKQFGLGFLLAVAWIGSFVSGFFKTYEPSPLALVVPLPIVGAIGILLLLGLREIQQDAERRRSAQREADRRGHALEFERGERQRQQEFMVMLTHELKAPLSTLGMVLGTPTASESMRRHAERALASMRQVIDHCAQSVEFEEPDAQLHREPCSLWVETELRHAALAGNERVRLGPDPGLPALQADRRMLAVILNNLLGNALAYSVPGSTVNVAVTRDTSGARVFQQLRVSNTAMDGPLPDPGRMFQKYYRGEAKRRGSGSGLGLHLSRLLARRMDGDLHYEARDRTVHLTLRLPE